MSYHFIIEGLNPSIMMPGIHSIINGIIILPADVPKLQRADTVAILPSSFVVSGRWPEVYKLDLKRLRDVFGLEPVTFPTTAKLGD